MNITLRLEESKDHRRVEEITREAFWNLYVPGACEHLLVHKLRQSIAFVPELDFVAELEGVVVGNIVYSKSQVINSAGAMHDIVTFGPVSVVPELHNKGIGTALIRHSVAKATAMGHKAIIILGYPEYYERFGFVNGKQYGISMPDGRYLKALQVLELYKGALQGVQGQFFADAIFDISVEDAEEFDKAFGYKEKQETESQKVFAQMVDMLAD